MKVFVLICLCLLWLNQCSFDRDFSVTQNSKPWHFSNNPHFSKIYGQAYEFDSIPSVFFDINTQGLKIQYGDVMLNKGLVCQASLKFYRFDDALLKDIVNRFRTSYLVAGLREEYSTDQDGAKKYQFILNSGSGRKVTIYGSRSLGIKVDIDNIHELCMDLDNPS